MAVADVEASTSGVVVAGVSTFDTDTRGEQQQHQSILRLAENQLSPLQESSLADDDAEFGDLVKDINLDIPPKQIKKKCSPEEINRKRQIAKERLKRRQEQLKTTMENEKCSPDEIAKKRQKAIERLEILKSPQKDDSNLNFVSQKYKMVKHFLSTYDNNETFTTNQILSISRSLGFNKYSKELLNSLNADGVFLKISDTIYKFKK